MKREVRKEHLRKCFLVAISIREPEIYNTGRNKKVKLVALDGKIWLGEEFVDNYREAFESYVCELGKKTVDFIFRNTKRLRKFQFSDKDLKRLAEEENE